MQYFQPRPIDVVNTSKKRYIITANDARREGVKTSLLDEPYYIADGTLKNMRDIATQNIVLIVHFQRLPHMTAWKPLASTKTMSPFPNFGKSTGEELGTALGYGSGKVVCTGCCKPANSIQSIYLTANAYSAVFNRPISMIKGSVINVVAKGRYNVPLDTVKLRQLKKSRFTSKFNGTTIRTKRPNSDKCTTMSLFATGSCLFPGVRTLADVTYVANQNTFDIMNCASAPKPGKT